MNATELINTNGTLHIAVNKYYWYNLERKNTVVHILVYTRDCKTEYGVAKLECVPVFGTGAFWVTSDKLEYVDNPSIYINQVNGQREITLSGNEILTQLSPYIPNLTNNEGTINV